MHLDFPDRLYLYQRLRAKKRQLFEKCNIYLTILSLLKISLCFIFRLLTSYSKSSLQPKGLWKK